MHSNPALDRMLGSRRILAEMGEAGHLPLDLVARGDRIIMKRLTGQNPAQDDIAENAIRGAGILYDRRQRQRAHWLHEAIFWTLTLLVGAATWLATTFSTGPTVIAAITTGSASIIVPKLMIWGSGTIVDVIKAKLNPDD